MRVRGSGPCVDITELILSQHHEQRRTFALLDELDRSDTAGLAAVWDRVTVMLEVHAEAEEKFFYPRLLKVGTGGGDADSVEEETEDAIKDHNEIRDADEANSEHMAEEERQDLVDFRRHADLKTRHEIAVQFIVYENQHAARGITPEDEDPDTYVAENS